MCVCVCVRSQRLRKGEKKKSSTKMLSLRNIVSVQRNTGVRALGCVAFAKDCCMSASISKAGFFAASFTVVAAEESFSAGLTSDAAGVSTDESLLARSSLRSDVPASCSWEFCAGKNCCCEDCCCSGGNCWEGCCCPAACAASVCPIIVVFGCAFGANPLSADATAVDPAAPEKSFEEDVVGAMRDVPPLRSKLFCC